MRILQVCNHYFPYVGGAEEYVRNISERLARKHEVSVFTTHPSSLPNEEEINGVLVAYAIFPMENTEYGRTDKNVLVTVQQVAF